MLGLKLNHVSKRGHNCYCYIFVVVVRDWIDMGYGLSIIQVWTIGLHMYSNWALLCWSLGVSLDSVRKLFNSLWPSDIIWQHESGSTLAHVMAFCLLAPSYYLNQCWLIISEVPLLSYTGNFRQKYWRYQTVPCVSKLCIWNSTLIS